MMMWQEPSGNGRRRVIRGELARCRAGVGIGLRRRQPELHGVSSDAANQLTGLDGTPPGH